MKQLRSAGLLMIGTFFFVVSSAQKSMIGKKSPTGAGKMNPSKNIVQNAANSKDLTTLMNAAKAAGMIEILQTNGPFTLFAPTNDAFSKLQKGTVETLLKPVNKMKLYDVISYHVVSGSFGTKELDAWIKTGKGTAELRTISGHNIRVSKKDGKYWLKDERGSQAEITISNLYQKNGVIQVIDHVIFPK
ncbi:MAG: fasciclin domain-containing protein [Bacteroidota bacterium]